MLVYRAECVPCQTSPSYKSLLRPFLAFANHNKKRVSGVFYGMGLKSILYGKALRAVIRSPYSLHIFLVCHNLILQTHIHIELSLIHI